MDSSDTNQDPLQNDSGATSFAPGLDMSAINEAVAAGGEADTPVADGSISDAAAPNITTSTDTTESAPQAEVAGFVDGDLANEAAPEAEPVAAEPIAADPIATDPITTDPVAADSSVDLSAEPNDLATPTEPFADPATPAAEPAPEVEPVATESQTIADLANSAAAMNPADQSVTTAPAATPPADMQPAQATPADAPTSKKSKTPTYILIGLALIAVVSVVIAVIVSQK